MKKLPISTIFSKFAKRFIPYIQTKNKCNWTVSKIEIFSYPIDNRK
jgi:hypothetical protein